jgi:hypothetical protein
MADRKQRVRKGLEIIITFTGMPSRTHFLQLGLLLKFSGPLKIAAAVDQAFNTGTCRGHVRFKAWQIL